MAVQERLRRLLSTVERQANLSKLRHKAPFGVAYAITYCTYNNYSFLSCPLLLFGVQF